MTKLTGEKLSEAIEQRIAAMPAHEVKGSTGNTIAREIQSMPKMKRGRSKAPATDASQFHELLRYLYHEHGIMAIHLQDQRVSEHLRNTMLLEGNMLYGRPPAKKSHARYGRGQW